MTLQVEVVMDRGMRCANRKFKRAIADRCRYSVASRQRLLAVVVAPQRLACEGLAAADNHTGRIPTFAVARGLPRLRGDERDPRPGNRALWA